MFTLSRSPEILSSNPPTRPREAAYLALRSLFSSCTGCGVAGSVAWGVFESPGEIVGRCECRRCGHRDEFEYLTTD